MKKNGDLYSIFDVMLLCNLVGVCNSNKHNGCCILSGRELVLQLGDSELLLKLGDLAIEVLPQSELMELVLHLSGLQHLLKLSDPCDKSQIVFILFCLHGLCSGWLNRLGICCDFWLCLSCWNRGNFISQPAIKMITIDSKFLTFILESIAF